MKQSSVGASDVDEEKTSASGGARERRKQERFNCKGFAEVVLDDVAFLFRGTIRNLSMTGCYIQSSARLIFDRGTTVELRFTVNQEELHVMATIMTVRPNSGAGFQFQELNQEMQSRLSSLVRKLATPATGQRTAAEVRADEAAEKEAASRDLWHSPR